VKIRFCNAFYREFETVQPLIEVLRKDPLFDIESRQGSSIPRIKNSFITDGTDEILDYSHWLIHDSDQYTHPEDIYKAIAHKKSVVSAPVLMQGGKKYCCGEFESLGKLKKHYRPTDGLTGLIPVDYSGDGFLLIERDVFVKYKEKYKTVDFFRTYPYMDKGLYRHPEWDIGFCSYLKGLKIKVWCDFDIKVQHKMRTHDNFDWETGKEKQVSQENLIDPNRLYTLKLDGQAISAIVNTLRKEPYDIAEPILRSIAPQVITPMGIDVPREAA